MNVLFINTDQMRFDAMSCAGNPFVHTPNLDRLAGEGVRFDYGITPQAMTAAAMLSYTVGLSVYSHGVLSAPEPGRRGIGSGSFDQNLVKAGYKAEYHGRWGMPDELMGCYENEVRQAWVSLYREHVRRSLGDPPKLGPGEFPCIWTEWPYAADPPDYQRRVSEGNPPLHNCYGVEYGVFRIPADHTLAAFISQGTIGAIRRHAGDPFCITAAFLHPHHPLYVAEPFAGRIDSSSLRPPASLHNERRNTPYEKTPWQIDATDIKHTAIMQARYYELVQELDHYVGSILDTLDELGIADRTLVIFTSDHGEMLCDHGLMQKFVPYQESVRIPMLMRLPGRIPAGTVVDEPVNAVDTFATIFDYARLPCPKQEGRSLRPLIEGKAGGYPEYTYSEMANYSAFISRRWKYVWHHDPEEMDVLFDLADDPHEMTNLLGANPDRARHVPRAEAIRKEMLAWMEGIDHPLRDKLAQSEVG